MIRLPTPFLPLHDSDIKKVAKLPYDDGNYRDARRIFAMAGNRVATARRCNLARLFLTLHGRHELALPEMIWSNPEGIQILTRVSPYHSINTFLTHLNSPTKYPSFVPNSDLLWHIGIVMQRTKFITDKSSEDSLILPEDFIEELKHAGLLK